MTDTGLLFTCLHGKYANDDGEEKKTINIITDNNNNNNNINISNSGLINIVIGDTDNLIQSLVEPKSLFS